MSLYIDTSCLLKLLLAEPESARVDEIVKSEPKVVVSSLTRVEALVRFQARFNARLLTRSGVESVIAGFETLLKLPPFEVQRCPSTLMEDAENQLHPIIQSTYCRTLDRLHLAAMTSFGLKRLLTNDDAQARAAKAIGLHVIMPR